MERLTARYLKIVDHKWEMYHCEFDLNYEKMTHKNSYYVKKSITIVFQVIPILVWNKMTIVSFLWISCRLITNIAYIN